MLFLFTESKELQIEDQKETKNKKVTNSSLALINFGASILAGILASLVTHPFDVIKTKVQVSKPPLKSGKITRIYPLKQ